MTAHREPDPRPPRHRGRPARGRRPAAALRGPAVATTRHRDRLGRAAGPGPLGLNPEWSTLYGTALWDEMTERAAGHADPSRGRLDHEHRHLVRDDPAADAPARRSTPPTPPTPEFQFALTEIADECRHSIMFARACQTMGVPHYLPHRAAVELGRGLKTVAAGEIAYGAILVAEEILDVMQRDWMRGEDVAADRAHDQQDPRGRGVAAHEVRPRRRSASTSQARRRRCAGAQRAGHRDRRARDRHAAWSTRASTRPPASTRTRAVAAGQGQRAPPHDDAHQLRAPDGLPVRGRPADAGRGARSTARVHML